MSKPLILYFIADSGLAGAPRQVNYLLHGMRTTYAVSVVCPKGWLADQAKKLEVSVHAYDPNLSRKGILDFVRAVIQKEVPELLHCHGIRAGIIGPYAARHLPTRVVYTEHLLTADFHLPSAIRQFVQLGALRRALKHVDHTVAVSEAVARFMGSKHLGNPAHRSVIYGAIEPIPGAKPVEDPVIGTIGSLTWVKGIDILLGAVKILKTNMPNLRCRIAGDGAMMQSLQALARRLHVTNNVEWLGQIDDPASFYQSLQVYVAPSRSESFGMAVLEAMSAGVPVVATPVGALPEFITDHQTGLLCAENSPSDFATKILRLLSDKALRGTIAQAGMEKARHFDTKTMAASYDTVYRGLL